MTFVGVIWLMLKASCLLCIDIGMLVKRAMKKVEHVSHSRIHSVLVRPRPGMIDCGGSAPGFLGDQIHPPSKGIWLTLQIICLLVS